MLAALADPDRALIELDRLDCEESLAEFTRQAWHVIEPGTRLKWNWHLDVMCAYVQAFFEGKVKRLILNVPPGPMRDDSLVETARGPALLRDIVVGDYVLTHKGRYRRVEAVHDQGVLPILRITTHSGRVTYAAPSHPYLTPSGWVDAGDLVVGDILAVVNRSEDRAGAIAVSAEESRLLGYLVGDGSITHAPGFTNADREVIDDFRLCAESLGFRTSEARRQSHWYVGLLGGESVRDFLRKHGLLGANSYTKRIPHTVMSSNRQSIANFIGAYWSCDGGIDVRASRTRGSRYRAYGTTVSEGLADDLVHALALLGINSRIRRKTRRLDTAAQPGGIYRSFSIEVQKEEDTARFADLPGMCGRKRELAGKCVRGFDMGLWPDPVVEIKTQQKAHCMCLTVDEDHSFVCSGIAVKNSMKSIIFSVMGPAWAWSIFPASRIINLTNEIGLATRDNRRMRQVIESDWYTEKWGHKVMLAKDQSEKTLFENTERGFRQGLGLTGNITGKRGNFLLIDDPVDAKKAFSDVVIKDANDTYDQAVSSRLNDPVEDSIGLIMQRLRTNDLTGHLMSKTRQKWVHVRIPMEYDGEQGYDPVADLGEEFAYLADPRTEIGELMFPDRFPRDVVEAMKEDLGTYGTAGQLNQRPNPLGGGIIKKNYWRKWPKDKALPHCLHIVASYDTAYTKNDLKESAYTARTTWGIFEDEATGKHAMILLEGWYERIEYPELRKEAKKHHRNFECDRALVEKKASGQSLVQDLRRIHIPVYGYDPGRLDKIARAYLSTPMFEAGQIYYPERAWAEKIIDYVADFPNGAPPSADLTDTVTQAVLYLKRGWWIKPPDEEEAEEVAHDPGEEWQEDEYIKTPGGAYG